MKGIVEDERTRAIENASYRWGYLLLMYGLLLSVAYRSLVLDEQSWDLLALVIGAGAVTTVYRSLRRANPDRWMLATAIAVLAALAAAAALWAGMN